MLSDSQLQGLLSTETDRVEWKRSAESTDGILRAVAALANDLSNTRAPGYVLVGVDKDGAISGIGPRHDDIQQRLTSRLRSSALQPCPSCDVLLHEVGGKTIVVVRVEPYPVPPIVAFSGDAWVRVGSTTRRASPADLRRLEERRPEGNWPFDTRRLVGATIDDLRLSNLEAEWSAAKSLDEDPESFPSFAAWLTQQELGVGSEGSWTPNATAILLFGKSPQDLLPGAWIDLARYRGVDVDAPVIARRNATGTVIDQLEAAWAWIEARIESVPTPGEGLIESFAPNYPVEALKELTRNLVQHRQYEGTNAPARVEWFDDRIEFSNPGGPFGRASEGEFGSHSDYRNPRLTKALVKLGYVQQLGRGVQRARLQLARNGNPPLEAETDGFTRVIIRELRCSP